MIVLGIILVLIVLVILFTLQLISKHAASDKLLVFYKGKRTPARLLSKTDEKIEFSVDVPYANQSRDEGIFLDAFVRIYLPDEQYNGALVRGRVNHPDAPQRKQNRRRSPPGHAGCGMCPVRGTPGTHGTVP